jgi:hypothetical protein
LGVAGDDAASKRLSATEKGLPRSRRGDDTESNRSQLSNGVILMPRAFLAILLLALLQAPDAGAATWSIEFMAGTSYHPDSTLKIEQSGEPNLEFSAQWETRPFEQPIFWDLRISRVANNRGWALDLMHDKLFLENPPPEVQEFGISHGLNFLTAQHLWFRSVIYWMAGAGVVIAHPENTVRGKKLPENGGLFDGGYSLAGPAAVGGIGARFLLFGKVFWNFEGRASLSHVWVDVVDGEASFSTIGLYFMFGMGIGI